MIDIGEILMMIEPLPSLRVFEVGFGKGVVTERLAAHLGSQEGYIDLFEYAPDEDTVARLGDIPNVNLKTLTGFDKPFRVVSREYETVVVTLLLNKVSDPKKLLEMCYHGLENSGTFLALCKEGEDDFDAINTLLDESHFVAMNRIDMKEGYFLATAKKLHHWGRGL